MTINMLVPLEVGIAVRDLSSMRRFYEEALGFQFVSQFEVPPANSEQAAMHTSGYTVARLQTSYGERIKLLAPNEPPTASPAIGHVLDKPNATYLTFIVDDIDALIGRLHAAGAEMMTGYQRVEIREGTYLSFCRDPEGNMFELVHYADIAAYRPDLQSAPVMPRNS
jgi:lactoylglutathione lyase